MILRTENSHPDWGPFQYATLSKKDLFSKERWGKTVEWNLLLEQTEQIDHAVSLLIKAPYPSSLFVRYIDILEANIYIFHDMFYYLTGGYFTDGISNDVKHPSHDDTWERLQFWNIDCHDIIMKIADSIAKSQNTFRNILQRYELKELNEIGDLYSEPAVEDLSAKLSPEEEPVFRYIKDIYNQKDIDEVALAKQIEDILIYFEQDSTDMLQWAHGWYCDCFLLGDFTSLLEKFVNSEKGRNIVQAWEHELNGTRENLLASLERVEKYQPWVYQYSHLSHVNNIIHELFASADKSKEIDDEKLNNTNNWINILSIAAILQAYDKRQEIINKLKPFFFNKEDEARSFYNTIKGADPIMVTAYVKQLVKDGKISEKGKSFYLVLHDNALYTPTYQNWNSQT